MCTIFIHQDDFNEALNRIKNPNPSLVGQLNTEPAPGGAFPSVREQFDLLQRICDTLKVYQAFLESDIESCKEFGEAFFALDEELRRQMIEGTEPRVGQTLGCRTE